MNKPTHAVFVSDETDWLKNDSGTTKDFVSVHDSAEAAYRWIARLLEAKGYAFHAESDWELTDRSGEVTRHPDTEEGRELMAWQFAYHLELMEYCNVYAIQSEGIE